jgi:ubiquinol-cytochrome c reductase cytochrome b subunit
MSQRPLESPYRGVLGWIDARLPLPRLIDKEYLKFRVPRNLNYFWSFGGILLMTLTLLILTGIVLAMH